MLWWYRIRDSRLWPVVATAFVAAVFFAGVWFGGRNGDTVVIEGYRRPDAAAPPVTNTVPLGTTTTLAPSVTLAPLLPLDAMRASLNDVLTEASRNRIEKPTLEMLGRFFEIASAVGLEDADGDSVDDDGTFSYVIGDITGCVALWGEPGPRVTEGACER